MQFAVLPQDPVSLDKPILPSELMAHYPRTYAYLKGFEDALLRRGSKINREMMDRYAFYAIYGIGPYSFAPVKVVWRYIATEFTVAVISDAVLPDGTKKGDCARVKVGHGAD